MKTIEKAQVSIFFDDENEPTGFIFFNKNKERVIYVTHKADEDKIISLFNNDNGKN